MNIKAVLPVQVLLFLWKRYVFGQADTAPNALRVLFILVCSVTICSCFFHFYHHELLKYLPLLDCNVWNCLYMPVEPRVSKAKHTYHIHTPVKSKLKKKLIDTHMLIHPHITDSCLERVTNGAGKHGGCTERDLSNQQFSSMDCN